MDTNSSGGFFVCCMYKKMKTSSIELQLDLRILYLSIIHQYTNFRPNYRSEGGATMDLKAVGQRIKAAREAKNLTQEELAALVNLSTTHVSVIERGLKVTKLDTLSDMTLVIEPRPRWRTSTAHSTLTIRQISRDIPFLCPTWWCCIREAKIRPITVRALVFSRCRSFYGKIPCVPPSCPRSRTKT